MATLGVTEWQLLALFLASMFWGFHLLIYLSCLRSLLFDRDGLKPRHRVDMRMVSVASVFLVLAGLDEGLLVYAIISAFSGFIGPKGGEEALNRVSNVVPTTRSAVLLLTTMIADAMLIWRCWIIFGKKLLVIALPSLLWVAAIALSLGALAFAQSSSGVADALVNAAKMQILITCFWICTIALNVLTTVMIVARLWMYERKTRRLGMLNVNSSSSFGNIAPGHRRNGSGSFLRRPSRTWDAMLTVVESGLVYTMTSSICFITYITGSNGIYPVTGMLIQIAGIAFDLIIIRSAARSQAHASAGSQGNPTASCDVSFAQTRSEIYSYPPRSNVIIDITRGRCGPEQFACDTAAADPPARHHFHPVLNSGLDGQKSPVTMV